MSSDILSCRKINFMSQEDLKKLIPDILTNRRISLIVEERLYGGNIDQEFLIDRCHMAPQLAGMFDFTRNRDVHLVDLPSDKGKPMQQTSQSPVEREDETKTSEIEQLREEMKNSQIKEMEEMRKEMKDIQRKLMEEKKADQEHIASLERELGERKQKEKFREQKTLERRLQEREEEEKERMEHMQRAKRNLWSRKDFEEESEDFGIPQANSTSVDERRSRYGKKERENEEQRNYRTTRSVTCPKRLTFSGSCEKDWRNFELDFRHWMQLEQIQLGSMKLFALGDALTGRAREHFNCVRMELNSFESIMDAMRMKFEKDRMELADTALVQLKMIQQQEKESYEEFEDRVSLLVYRAFPNSSDSERIRQSVIAFTQGVADRNLRKDLMKMYVRNMQEVIAYVVRYQHAQELCRYHQY